MSVVTRIRTSQELTVPFTPEEVWGVLADVAAYPEWWPAKLRVEILNHTGELLGTEFEVRPVLGRMFRIRFEEVEGRRNMRLRFFGGSLEGPGGFHLLALEGATRVRYEMDVFTRGLDIAALSVVLPLESIHRWRMRSVLNSLAARLKSLRKAADRKAVQATRSLDRESDRSREVEAAAALRLAEEEARRQVEREAAARAAAEGAERRAAEEEAARRAEEAEAKARAEAEAARQAAEEEARRRAEEQSAARAAAEEAERRAAEEEARQVAAAEALRKQVEEEAAARAAAEEAERRAAEEEAARRAEEAAAKARAEAEAARRAAEEEATKRAEEENAARAAAEEAERRAAEGEALRVAAEEASRRRLEEEAAARTVAEEASRKEARQAAAQARDAASDGFGDVDHAERAGDASPAPRRQSLWGRIMDWLREPPASATSPALPEDPADEPATSAGSSNFDIARLYLDALSSRATGDEIGKFFAPEAVHEEFPHRFLDTAVTRGFTGILEARSEALARFSSQRYDLIGATGGGSQVALEVAWRGVVGDGMGLFVEGQKLEARLGIFLKFQDGLIVTQRSYRCVFPDAAAKM